MRVQDATGGTIKSGGKTRRAAIMQTLKVWHPDIMEFVEAKMEEEKKAWALIEEGYDGSFNGPAYGSVAFQNVNQSVRVTDAFMSAAEHDDHFGLKAVLSGEVVEEVRATKVLDRIAQGTHLCGDPGLQYEDTIQRWHTCKTTGPINSSNPCSEYMFLDNSACNLASLNLRKYQKDDGSVDVERLRAAARIYITAQEILVDNAGYPSADIARNSHLFRPLGLGFANLGALLMSMGLPYDSDEGRAVAGAIMAIEHCEGYARSAEIAANDAIGPFPGYAENREPFLEVMQMHHDAVDDIDPTCPDYLRKAAEESADRMVALGHRHGYRNAQATVLAPTGTIGFMMDCDTTGVEPDIALVKYKLLAGKGDGMMKIVNRTVPLALKRLGYSEDEVMAIIEYIDHNDTIEGAPILKDEHLPVFDCAFKPQNGERSIHHLGHIKMMAACQPFISGAISKTVNMPEDATVEAIADAYLQGWKLGLKALAIYRENSKRSQPLSTSKDGNTKKAKKKAAEASGDGVAGDVEPEIVEKVVEKVVYKPVRKRLPDERPSLTHKFSIAGHEGYLHIGLYPETQMPGEIFITMAKEGSTISGLMDAFATAISIALQYGVPLEDLCRKFSHMRFEPNGFTNNKQVPIAKSIMDYIFRYLSVKFLQQPVVDDETEDAVNPNEAVAAEARRSGPARDETQMGLFDGADPAEVDPLVGQTIEAFMAHAKPAADPADAATPAPASGQTFQNQDDSPPCPNCGAITVRSGACYVCTQCGTSSGCG
jgi:ribonucleoside-diphosphate reductase alpha chain